MAEGSARLRIVLRGFNRHVHRGLDRGKRGGLAVYGELAILRGGRHAANDEAAGAADQRGRVLHLARGRGGVRVGRGRRVARHAADHVAGPAVIHRDEVLQRRAVDHVADVVAAVRGGGYARVRRGRGLRLLGEVRLQLGDGQQLRHVAADIARLAVVIHLIPGVAAVALLAHDQQQRVHGDAAQRGAGGGRRETQVHRILDQLRVGAGGFRADGLGGDLRHRGRGGQLGLKRSEVLLRLLLAHQADEVGADEAPLARVLHEVPRHAIGSHLALEDVDDGLRIQHVLEIRHAVGIAAQRRAVRKHARVDAQLLRFGRGGGHRGRRRFGRRGRGREGLEVARHLAVGHQANLIVVDVAVLVIAVDDIAPVHAIAVDHALADVHRRIDRKAGLQRGVIVRVTADIRVVVGDDAVALDGLRGRGRGDFRLGGFLVLRRNLRGFLRGLLSRLFGGFFGRLLGRLLRRFLGRRGRGDLLRVFKRRRVGDLLVHAHQRDELAHDRAVLHLTVDLGADSAPLAVIAHDPQRRALGEVAPCVLRIGGLAELDLLVVGVAVVVHIADGQLLRDIRFRRGRGFRGRLFGHLRGRFLRRLRGRRVIRLDLGFDFVDGGLGLLTAHFLDLIGRDVAGVPGAHILHQIPKLAVLALGAVQHEQRGGLADERHAAGNRRVCVRRFHQHDGRVVALLQRHQVSRNVILRGFLSRFRRGFFGGFRSRLLGRFDRRLSGGLLRGFRGRFLRGLGSRFGGRLFRGFRGRFLGRLGSRFGGRLLGRFCRRFLGRLGGRLILRDLLEQHAGLLHGDFLQQVIAHVAGVARADDRHGIPQVVIAVHHALAHEHQLAVFKDDRVLGVGLAAQVVGVVLAVGHGVAAALGLGGGFRGRLLGRLDRGLLRRFGSRLLSRFGSGLLSGFSCRFLGRLRRGFLSRFLSRFSRRFLSRLCRGFLGQVQLRVDLLHQQQGARFIQCADHIGHDVACGLHAVIVRLPPDRAVRVDDVIEHLEHVAKVHFDHQRLVRLVRGGAQVGAILIRGHVQRHVDLNRRLGGFRGRFLGRLDRGLCRRFHCRFRRGFFSGFRGRFLRRLRRGFLGRFRGRLLRGFRRRFFRRFRGRLLGGLRRGFLGRFRRGLLRRFRRGLLRRFRRGLLRGFRGRLFSGLWGRLLGGFRGRFLRRFRSRGLVAELAQQRVGLFRGLRGHQHIAQHHGDHSIRVDRIGHVHGHVGLKRVKRRQPNGLALLVVEHELALRKRGALLLGQQGLIHPVYGIAQRGDDRLYRQGLLRAVAKRDEHLRKQLPVLGRRQRRRQREHDAQRQGNQPAGDLFHMISSFFRGSSQRASMRAQRAGPVPMVTI